MRDATTNPTDQHRSRNRSTSHNEMPTDNSTETPDDQSPPELTATTRWGRRLTTATVVITLVAVEPALASESAVCETEQLPEMISGFFQLTTTMGLIGLVVVWQADALIEMFTLSTEQLESLKRHKRSALKSAAVLVLLGPLYTVAGDTMNLPLASCVDLVPW